VSDELVDVGYRDPWEEPDIVRDPPPAAAEYADGDRPRIAELGITGWIDVRRWEKAYGGTPWMLARRDRRDLPQ
jgi:hypothetical protein